MSISTENTAPAAKRYYITTPIFYVNDKPHIGHAYNMVANDVMARFKRLDGYDVRLLTGTDEHGQKVAEAAAAGDTTPQALCDRNSENFRALTKTLGLSNDDFIRTTEPRHHAASQAIWRAMEVAGDIYLDRYAGWYSVRDEQFFGESELTVQDGKRIAPTGAECEWVEEPSYFFRLSAFAERLLAHYDAQPDFILPATRRNEVVSFVKSGLRDLAISRTTFDWGIPVPGADGHVMYVWVDALTNYMTAVGYPDEKSEFFQKWWPADLHLIGKDILRFHAVYWPAFLMSAGLPLPRRVFAHGWLLIDGQKMSKSLGNVVDPNDLVGDFGVDQVRYALMREVPFGNDGGFSHSAMIRRINGDLANDLGNLAQRVLSMIAKNCGHQVPTPGEFSDEDAAMMGAALDSLPAAREAADRQAFHTYLEAVWSVIAKANVYIDQQAPWTLRKTDPPRMATVLYVAAETIRRVAIQLQAVMPTAMEKLLDQLAVPADRRDFRCVGDETCRLEPGRDLPAPSGLFPRIVIED